ncbi:MAG: DNA-protecting protein DprA [Acidobacteria bacterium]|nr:DNA-protecting protein DprA [Acidobacteriota bacterium]
MPPPVDIDTVALALLRPGPDTLACRLLKQAPEPLTAFARRLPGPASEVHLRVGEARQWARSCLEAGRATGLRVLAVGTPEYPARLTEIVDPPIVLWALGAADPDARCVAIVGSRRATPSGLLVARQLAQNLAAANWTVVSGMALGVDGAAHEAALAAGGPTIAVLGCGADVVYPREHRSLARRIAEHGVILSEFPPGTAPRPWHFPLRNRIISGLAQAVVVVEASERSGSLITARLAMEQGRDVLAVPGSVVSGRYRGCHALIRDGARLVETVDDILDELEGVSRLRHERIANLSEISELEEAMAVGEPYGVDDLARITGRAAGTLLAELGVLEVQGKISRAGGGNFVRLDAAASVK